MLIWWKDWKKKCELLQGAVLAGRCSAVDHRGWGLTPRAGQCWLQGFEDRLGKASPSRQRPDPQPRRTCTAPSASWFTALWPGCSARTLSCAAFLQEGGQRLIPSKLQARNYSNLDCLYSPNLALSYSPSLLPSCSLHCCLSCSVWNFFNTLKQRFNCATAHFPKCYIWPEGCGHWGCHLPEISCL